MIRGFADQGSEDVWRAHNTAVARRIPRDIWASAQRKLDMLDAARDLNDLRILPGNRLEKLYADLAGLHSIRVNDRWRIVFRWTGLGADEVRIVDYH